MKLRKILFAGLALGLLLPQLAGAAPAADNRPACVLMKFTDDTRYDAIETAEQLSELVMVRLLDSHRFRLMETRPLEENMERELYREKMQELQEFKTAAATHDYNALFEGPGFRENKAQSIATASVGQIVTPSITRAIGEQHKADYLIQGTIINMGIGNWWNMDYAAMSTAVNTASALAATPISVSLSGISGPLGGMLGDIKISRSGIGIECDIRLIKAATGEVLWTKRVVGLATNRGITIGSVTLGSARLSSSLYRKALEQAAGKVTEALLADVETGKLFLK